MGFEHAKEIANAMLLTGEPGGEGRRRREHSRWTFGVVAPRAWSEATRRETSSIDAQLIVAGRGAIAGRLRFLRTVTRRVESLDGSFFSSDDGEVTEIDFEIVVPHEGDEPHSFRFALGAPRSIDVLTDASGEITGRVVCARAAIAGVVRATMEPVARDLVRLTVRVDNLTPFDRLDAPRAEALRASFLSTHLIFSATGGAKFTSVVRPPKRAREAVASCRSAGTWPILADERTMLCAPVRRDERDDDLTSSRCA